MTTPTGTPKYKPRRNASSSKLIDLRAMVGVDIYVKYGLMGLKLQKRCCFAAGQIIALKMSTIVYSSIRTHCSPRIIIRGVKDTGPAGPAVQLVLETRAVAHRFNSFNSADEIGQFE